MDYDAVDWVEFSKKVDSEIENLRIHNWASEAYMNELFNKLLKVIKKVLKELSPNVRSLGKTRKEYPPWFTPELKELKRNLDQSHE